MENRQVASSLLRKKDLMRSKYSRKLFLERVQLRQPLPRLAWFRFAPRKSHSALGLPENPWQLWRQKAPKMANPCGFFATYWNPWYPMVSPIFRHCQRSCCWVHFANQIPLHPIVSSDPHII